MLVLVGVLGLLKGVYHGWIAKFLGFVILAHGITTGSTFLDLGEK